MQATVAAPDAALLTTTARRAAAAVAAFLGQCRLVVVRLASDWNRARRIRATRAALEQLDAATLRDLGLHRCEAGSIALELGRVTMATRRRIYESAGFYF